jgi:hypothetical protein
MVAMGLPFHETVKAEAARGALWSAAYWKRREKFLSKGTLGYATSTVCVCPRCVQLKVTRVTARRITNFIYYRYWNC